MNETDVLIVGAGPTGLSLALFLAKAGVTPRIIDKNLGPGQASRALGVQARTLEFYRQLGFADDVVAQGIQVTGIKLRAHGRSIADVNIAEFGEGLSPYPFILSFPQDEHEQFLVRQLEAVGIGVEWDTELLDLRDAGDAVQTTLRKNDGIESVCTASYVCGCDGARSIVRKDTRLGFAGGTYDNTYFVADVEATGEATSGSNFSICFGAQGVLIVLPVRTTGMNRLIGVLPKELNDREGVSFEDLRPYAEKEAGIVVKTVNWFSTYKAHHRVADHFRIGRSFVLGDAGHIHSPVGGQGMNTGIGDAVNLSWKLAAVVQNRAPESLLDTYEPERIAFARLLVATTDKMFTLMTGTGIGPQLFRETLLPYLAPFALGFSNVRTAAFRLVSQTRISYHDSALSSGVAGGVQGGDRLPWVNGAGGSDNFAPLQSFDWQVHVYGEASEALSDVAQSAELPLHQFAWTDAMQNAGLERDALYLIRPDGYVALADAAQNVETLRAHIGKFRLMPSATVQG
jgi:2-polyprenyl-6-methoxyphenol hydroxylase-like FAD-dependent oxidoreductase